MLRRSRCDSGSNFEPKIGGLVASLFDNIGFLKKGKNTTYVQFTTRVWEDIPLAVLEKYGITKASRTRRPYEEAFPNARAA